MKYTPNKGKDIIPNGILKSGDIVNRWTVLQVGEKEKWLCICSCGLIKDVNIYNLRKGYSRSCGNRGCVEVDRTQQEKIEKPCVICGKPTKRFRNVGTKKFACSEKCRAAVNSQYISNKRRQSVLNTVICNLSQIRTRCKKRKLEYDLDPDYIGEMLEKQLGLCALTGDTLMASDGSNYSVSVDRIDPTKGYIKGNIQLVSKAANIAKYCLSMDEFLTLCKKVVCKHGKS